MEEVYELQQLVYAKVTGYPHWPAQIVEILSNNIYRVIYYGTNQYGFVDCKHLKPFNYFTNKKFINKAALKRRHFKEAVEQAFAASIPVHEEPQDNRHLQMSPDKPTISIGFF